MKSSQAIGRRLMVGIHGDSLDEETRTQLRLLSPGAVILFSRNIRNREQAGRLIGEIKKISDPAPLIAIDQEGGLVVRFFREVTVMPGNMALGATGAPELAYAQGRSMARELKALGIDVNLAPVVDVATNPDNPGITIRSFGGDPEKVAEFGVQCVQGIQSEGVGAVAKHFPGKGAAGKDAHFDLPVVEASAEEMARVHLHPFARCIAAGVQGVMSSHVIYRNLPGAEQAPATFAGDLINGLLRERAGFSGVVFSDDLEMGAISKFFRFEEAVARAAAAGHDMLLVCSDYEKQRQALSVLTEMVRSDARAARETQESISRIEVLREFCRHNGEGGGAPGEPEGAELAGRIAEESITLLQGRVALPLSITKKTKVCVILPELAGLESIEEGFEAEETNVVGRMVKERLKSEGGITFIPLDPSEGDIERVWEKAGSAELVLAFIFNARFLRGQRQLLERLKTVSEKAVAVLIRNPFDWEFCGRELTTVITYGYRRVQMEAAVKVIAGEISAHGKVPI
jgi:beta-N-acetylhexosaminidase